MSHNIYPMKQEANRMTNFDFLLSEPQLKSFGEIAVSAEQIYSIDPAACVLNCRRCMEFAVKWMYSVDRELVLPDDNKLATLMNSRAFRDVVDHNLWCRLTYIRQTGNHAAHKEKKLSSKQAELCLENLWYFMDFLACCYGERYTPSKFDVTLLSSHTQKESPLQQEWISEIDVSALMAENKDLREQLTTRRGKQQPNYITKPLNLDEKETRKLYIDAMLSDVGWVEGKNWLNEVYLSHMPNKSGRGYADYVLFDDTHRPFAVIEAKSSSIDPKEGRQEVKLYADSLEKEYGRRPVIFMTNGFETYIDDGIYTKRPVATIYSKRDLEKLFNLRTMKTSLENIQINQNIAGRYYQEEAIKAVCTALMQNKRKALLVMATGSGKTRTVIALVDVLLRHCWIKNVLFLADRTTLVTQAKRNFVNLLPNCPSATNLCENKKDYTAHCVFSTYQTMMNCIDTVKDQEGKLFTTGHFDLVICDEAHRSIYNKYKDIFTYFDAPLIGLTATPKDEIDRNTYQVFELQQGIPTYGYELTQAVQDGFLVYPKVADVQLKFLKDGIYYDRLSESEREEYENTFTDEHGQLPAHIDSAKLNEYIFNEDTIRKSLHSLMTQGLRIDYGETLGKTIIFAKNHNHAEKILDVFEKEYPHLTGYAKVIDNYMAYAQNAIDEFSDNKKLPRIAISVDMLDTGIDIPDILNLVFFKKVISKAKFWQMVGRGTRLCPGLMDGKDKDTYYIFDFCENFKFFQINKKKLTANQMPLQSSMFYLKAQIVYNLQDLIYQTPDLIQFRETLVEEMCRKVQELNCDSFSVRQHLRYVERFRRIEGYTALSYEDTMEIRDEIAPLIQPDKDEISAVRFDALMYGIELAYLAGKKYARAHKDLINKVSGVASVANIPEIQAEKEFIETILHTDYLKHADINKFEQIRLCLRGLMKYLPHDSAIYYTNFTDEILSINWNEPEMETNDLKNYKEKAEYYVRQHQENIAIAKLHSNIPLTEEDIKELEVILWSEVGSKADYEAEYGQKPLGEFVREIVGLDMKAAKEAFSQYLNNVNLDHRQIYFVNQIIEYIVHNGLMKDLSVLQESPFTDHGSIVELFTDFSIWTGIKDVINQINANAAA